MAACRELGLRCAALDGTSDIDTNVALLEDQFREYLPAIPNV